MRSHFILLAAVFIITLMAANAEENMQNMPRIRPKKVYTIPSKEAGEKLLEQRGYGDQEPMVRMMNLMMVGGSGYEGMDMSEMGDHSKHEHKGHEMK